MAKGAKRSTSTLYYLHVVPSRGAADAPPLARSLTHSLTHSRAYHACMYVQDSSKTRQSVATRLVPPPPRVVVGRTNHSDAKVRPQTKHNPPAEPPAPPARLGVLCPTRFDTPVSTATAQGGREVDERRVSSLADQASGRRCSPLPKRRPPSSLLPGLLSLLPALALGFQQLLVVCIFRRLRSAHGVSSSSSASSCCCCRCGGGCGGGCGGRGGGGGGNNIPATVFASAAAASGLALAAAPAVVVDVDGMAAPCPSSRVGCSEGDLCRHPELAGEAARLLLHPVHLVLQSCLVWCGWWLVERRHRATSHAHVRARGGVATASTSRRGFTMGREVHYLLCVVLVSGTAAKKKQRKQSRSRSSSDTHAEKRTTCFRYKYSAASCRDFEWHTVTSPTEPRP